MKYFTYYASLNWQLIVGEYMKLVELSNIVLSINNSVIDPCSDWVYLQHSNSFVVYNIDIFYSNIDSSSNKSNDVYGWGYIFSTDHS